MWDMLKEFGTAAEVEWEIDRGIWLKLGTLLCWQLEAVVLEVVLVC